MKKILLLFVILPAALLGMDKDMYFKKDSCNLGFYAQPLQEGDNQCAKYSRYEVFSGKKCIGSVAYNKSECTFDMLYLLSDVRRKGLGTLLFWKAFEDLKQAGCKKIIIREVINNAGPFYEKFGAKLVDERCDKFRAYDMYIDIDEDNKN